MKLLFVLLLIKLHLSTQVGDNCSLLGEVILETCLTLLKLSYVREGRLEVVLCGHTSRALFFEFSMHLLQLACQAVYLIVVLVYGALGLSLQFRHLLIVTITLMFELLAKVTESCFQVIVLLAGVQLDVVCLLTFLIAGRALTLQLYLEASKLTHLSLSGSFDLHGLVDLALELCRQLVHLLLEALLARLALLRELGEIVCLRGQVLLKSNYLGHNVILFG